MVIKLVSGTPGRAPRILVPIYNLDSGGAAGLVIGRALATLPGVRHIYANPAAEAVHVHYDPAQVNPQAIIGAVAARGLHTGEPRIG